MGDILQTALILSGLCLAFGAILAVAHRKLKVWEDPRIDQVEEKLPGANCGACGKPGCRAFAEEVVSGEINPGKCTVSPPEKIDEIAGMLGVEVQEEVKVVARLLCAGGKEEANYTATYERGVSTCRAEALVAGGPKQCAWGCLGLGDCETACTFGAISMSVNGLPLVDTDKCTACNDCVEECPRDLFELMPIDQKLIVQCKSLLEGDQALEQCAVACTACGKCALDAGEGVISMKNNLAVINYSNYELAGPEAVLRCPTGAITWLRSNNQFRDEQIPDFQILNEYHQ
ncbi:MAG: RnfABCDGE type electron transport complex subunit B [Cyclobacteriaceae bacterium]|nr:RnfABCDGE type electron transport complex subunit B [Cyclobacteriaceae bacterium]